jgi:N-acetylglucosamine-6-sulfatase
MSITRFAVIRQPYRVSDKDRVIDRGDESIGYFNFRVNENGELHHNGTAPRDYITDVLAAKAVRFIHAKAHGTQPFFLLITPTAPHDTHNSNGPIPAPRHKGVFPNLPFPQEPNFNEADVSDKPAGSGVCRR